jgi:hypothetical protein
MQTLRDTAALAILILLALTVRVSLDGEPVDLELATPAAAAAEHEAPQGSHPVPAAHPAGDAFLPGVANDLAPVLPRRIVPTRASTQPRQLVWEIDGRRVVIVLGGPGGEPSAEIDPPSTPASEPCDQARRARLSS